MKFTSKMNNSKFWNWIFLIIPIINIFLYSVLMIQNKISVFIGVPIILISIYTLINSCKKLKELNMILRCTRIQDTKTGEMIYSGDTVKCFDNAALDESWGLDKIHTGVIGFHPDGNSFLDVNGVKLDAWYNAENIEIVK